MKLLVRFCAYAVVPLFVGQSVLAAQSGDAVAGQRLFNTCSGCHQIGEGAANRVGPHLNGIFGRRAASLEDFRYSTGFKRAGSKGLEWHAENLDVFLENPKQLVPGTRMSFRGMKDAQERADLISYLRTFSDSPSDIPEADPTAKATDHDNDPEILAIEGDKEYGEYLSGECIACHQLDGGDEGIPSIVGWPEQNFLAAMHAYKGKVREHPVMNLVAGRLGDEEIAALAAYFAQLPD